jgi:dihydrodipicolinate synthase/N-acetylneuraminate lyase
MESQIMGAEAIAMYDLVTAGWLDQARAVQMRTLSLDLRMRKHGTFPANLKTAMNLLGRTGGFPRRPLLPLTPAETDQVREVLASLGMTAVAA